MNDNDVDRVGRIRRAAERQGLMLTGSLPREADSDAFALVDKGGAWAYGTLDDMEDYLIDLGEVISDDDVSVSDYAAGRMATSISDDPSSDKLAALRARIKGKISARVAETLRRAEVDHRIAHMRASLPTDPWVTDLVAFAEGLDATADPNVKRIQLAAQTLVAFQRLSDPESWERSEAPDALTDVLAHLMHLSPIIGGDFDVLLAGARSHFAEESVQPWL